MTIKGKKISTTKLLITFLFINCTLLEIFTGWITIWNLILARDVGATIDFTPLITLIGVVIGEVFGFAIYALKSMKENTKGGIVYEQECQKWSNTKEEFNEEGV